MPRTIIRDAILRTASDAFAAGAAQGKSFPRNLPILDGMLGRREREEQLEGLLSQAQSRIHELEADLRARNESARVRGLGTLDKLRNQLDMEAAGARRHGRPLSVAVLDIDDFRALCARHG